MGDGTYTSDQLYDWLTKNDYGLSSKPKNNKWFFEHKTNNELRHLIVPIGRDNFDENYVKLLFKSTPISFSDFKKFIS